MRARDRFIHSRSLVLLVALPALSCAQAGVDPVHLGVVVVYNLMVGLLTPPMGMSLFLVSEIGEGAGGAHPARADRVLCSAVRDDSRPDAFPQAVLVVAIASARELNAHLCPTFQAGSVPGDASPQP
jgi:Tripartite ATP-independent periplasmic transporter, DctM component